MPTTPPLWQQTTSDLPRTQPPPIFRRGLCAVVGWKSAVNTYCGIPLTSSSIFVASHLSQGRGFGCFAPPHPSRSFVAIHPPPLWGEGFGASHLLQVVNDGSFICYGSTTKLLGGFPIRGPRGPLVGRFKAWGFQRGEGNRNPSPLWLLFPRFLSTQKVGPRRGGRDWQ